MEIRVSREYLEELDRRRAVTDPGLFIRNGQTVYGNSVGAVVAAFHIGPPLVLRKGGRHAIIRAS